MKNWLFCSLLAFAVSAGVAHGQTRRYKDSDAVPYNSVEALDRAIKFREKMILDTQGEVDRAKKSPGTVSIVLGETRDAVIGARAVARYIMQKEGVKEADRQFVEEYLAKARFTAKPSDAALQLLDRDEFKAWIAAEDKYQLLLKK